MLKKIKMHVLNNAEHLLRKLSASLPKSTLLNNETSAPILVSTNEPNEVIAAKDQLKRIEAQCADAIKQCNRDVREMFSSARAECEEIIRNAKKKLKLTPVAHQILELLSME